MTTHGGALMCLRALIHASALPAWIADPTGAVVEVNARFCALTGLPAEALVGRYSLSRDRTLVEQGHAEAVSAALSAGRGLEFLYRYDSVALGLPLEPPIIAHLRVILCPLADAQGRFDYALVQIIDVTQERHAFETLRQSQERFELILEGTEDGLWDWDLTNNHVFYSARWKAMLGYAPDELEDHLDTWSRLIHPEDSEAAWQQFHAYIEGRAARFQCEFRMRHKAGHWVPIFSRAFNRLDTQKRPTALIGTHVDLTSLKAAEAATRREAALNHSVIEHMAEGLCLGARRDEPNARFSIWNRRMVEITGYSHEEINALGWFEALYPDPARRADALARAALEREGQPLLNEPWLITRKDGQTRTVGLSTAALPSGEALVLVRDLTQQRAEELERREWERHVQESQRLESLGVLAGGVAHDFNNILMVVSGNLEMARLDLAPGSVIAPLLSEAEAALERALSLTQQMLAYSGRGRFIIGPVDLSALVEALSGLLRAAVPKQVPIELELTRPLPLIEADVAQMQQVVMNLIINAAESYEGRPSGSVRVRTALRRLSQAALSDMMTLPGLTPFPAPGEYVVIEIEDQGCGMSEAVRARIFEPFFTTKFTGRGLGMSAVLGIVRGHDGLMTLESAPDQGTRWQVMFPQRKLYSAPMRPPITADAWRGAGAVLVVDDEPGVRALVAQMLSRLGYVPSTASGGKEALRLYAVEPFDCVLLDISMPDMSGVETLQALRASDPRARVILSSGYDEEERLYAEVKLGAELGVSFLKKPFGINALDKAMCAALTAKLGKPEPKPKPRRL